MENYKWNLGEMFESDEAFEKAFAEFSRDFEGIARWKGILGNSKENIVGYLKESDELERRGYNMLVYAHMRNDLDTRDSKSQDILTRIERAMTNYSMANSFAGPELLAVDEDVLRSIPNEPGMADYSHMIDNLIRNKKHVLSPELENMLAMTKQFSDAADKAYGKLKDADLVYEDVADSEGKAHPLTEASYGKYMESRDRVLRKNTFEKKYAAYISHINTFASLLESEVKKNIFYARARGFESARHAALHGNNVPVSVMDSMIDAVHANLPTLYRVFDIRRRALGYDELHLYDNNVTIADCDFEVPFEEGKKMVLEAVKIYGSDYAEIAECGLNSGWADVYESEGKRGGAYSWGSYDSAPYMLLNYNDTLDSVFTLAHELGHSMHSYYTRKAQPYVNSHYATFVAEVASTCNECLLNDYLLKNEKDADKRKYIIGNFIDSFKGTIFRQAMFAEFERDIHARVEAGGSLTVDYLCDHYLELVKLYFGPNVVCDEQIKYEWARIPHFYMNFYVFQYSTGFSAAVALSKQILEGRTDNAFKFLSSGGSDYPIQILRNAGIEMETSETVENALKVFKQLVDEYEILAK